MDAPMTRLVRSRTRKRGTVMIESLIVIWMLISALMVIGYLDFLYSTKLDTMRFAKMTAWQTAIYGCGGPLVLEAEPPEVPENPEGMDINIAGVTYTETAKEFTDFNGDPLPISSTTQVACNETPQPHSDILSILEWAMQTILPGGAF
jgi:hypothetical protein